MIFRKRSLAIRYPFIWIAILYTLLIVEGRMEAKEARGECKEVRNRQHLMAVVSDRMAKPHLKEAIMGAILYLDDMQIRPRSGPRSSRYDACSEGICIPFYYLNLSFLDIYLPVPNPFSGIRNEVGEWVSTIHFLPRWIGDADGESLVTLQDSNLFVSAAITYPMSLFSENSLGENSVMRPMRQLVLRNIQKYKRNHAYNFWTQLEGVKSPAPRVGPYNIPIPFVEMLSRSYIDPATKELWNQIVGDLDVPSRDWVLQLLDRHKNPAGVDAAFNIPNDADDTAIAVAMQKLISRDIPGTKVDLAALAELKAYRDRGRRLEEPRDGWKGKNSGAYLTWLKDENTPTFADPDSGVIPLAANNVDCVVNANALFSLSLNGLKSYPGFDEASDLMLKVVSLGEWKNRCGHYYPQKMSFPYSVTRAYRDGGARNATMTTAMGLLLNDLLRDQRPDGSYAGGKDATRDLATALAVVSLLNIGRDLAERQSLAARYDTAIDNGVSFLLKHRQRHVLYNQETLQPFTRRQWSSLADETYESVRSRFGYRWQSGLFFSASFWDLAQWRSEAYTVSIVLEALAKYLMAYDLGQVSISEGRRIHVEGYAASADDAEPDFVIKIE